MARVQLALNVPDIDHAGGLYRRLFTTDPNKRKPGYANFAIAEPPLKLALFENVDAKERLNHLGGAPSRHADGSADALCCTSVPESAARWC